MFNFNSLILNFQYFYNSYQFYGLYHGVTSLRQPMRTRKHWTAVLSKYETPTTDRTYDLQVLSRAINLQTTRSVYSGLYFWLQSVRQIDKRSYSGTDRQLPHIRYEWSPLHFVKVPLKTSYHWAHDYNWYVN